MSKTSLEKELEEHQEEWERLVKLEQYDEASMVRVTIERLKREIEANEKQ